MAGIYIHIPFCRQACHYCDFHFSTHLKNQNDVVSAIVKELITRKNYFNESVKTIYFGGGTPSLLTTGQIEAILETISIHFAVADDVELTFEANPEDISLERSVQLKDLGINRLSIGIQTFNEEKLKWMNRAHDLDQTYQAFEYARNAGFQNISLDLIYALPNVEDNYWKEDLDRAVGLGPEHISLYGLTIEEKTVFGSQKKKGVLKEVSEDLAADQYFFAVEFLKENGYQQYEISNFGKPDHYSRHNLAYWAGTSYLGVGPGAHSFDGGSRQMNVRNNHQYLRAIGHEQIYFEVEHLTLTDLINERILTSLRRSIGIDLEELKEKFDLDLIEAFPLLIEGFIGKDLMIHADGHLKLTTAGFLVADEIALQLFFQE